MKMNRDCLSLLLSWAIQYGHFLPEHPCHKVYWRHRMSGHSHLLLIQSSPNTMLSTMSPTHADNIVRFVTLITFRLECRPRSCPTPGRKAVSTLATTPTQRRIGSLFDSVGTVLSYNTVQVKVRKPNGIPVVTL